MEEDLRQHRCCPNAHCDALMTAYVAVVGLGLRPGTSDRGCTPGKMIRIFDIVCTPDDIRHTGQAATINAQ